MLRLAATGLLVAVAVAGLSACSTAGSAHPVAVGQDASTTSLTAQASPTPTADATAVSGPATGSPAAAPVNGAGTGRSSTGGAAPAHTATGGTTSGGTGTTGGSGSGGAAPVAPGPRIAGFHVTKAPSCADQNVTIAWSISGASGAALSVDQPGTYGAYETGLPASGSVELPIVCSAGSTVSHTYTIFPAGDPGVSKSITVSAHSDG